MSSLRAKRRRSCTNKVRHLTEQAAWSAVRGTVKAMTGVVGALRPYRCQFCSGWHVGHANPRRAR